MSEIEYFYSAHSAFAYLGSRRFQEIADAAGCRIVHRPIDLTTAIAGSGSTPTTKRSAGHRAYFFGREIQRWSEERAAPVMAGMPTHHWNDPAMANRMLIAADEQGEVVDAFAHALLEAHWRDDADLADGSQLRALADRVGFDGAALLDAARDGEIESRYRANTEEAVARSVFGSPTYFVDGDMFYGQDRLELVERAIGQAYRGTWPPK